MPVKIVIREEVFIQGLPQDLVEFFCEQNTFPNPKFEMLERLGKWTGGTRRTIELWRRAGDWLALPRGYYSNIAGILEKHGITGQVEHATVCPPLTIPRLKPAGELFDYQWSALCELKVHNTGVMEAPTGSGKTNILLTLAADMGTPTLIIVHTTELANQTVKRCKSWLNYEPGFIGGGKYKVEDITVAMIQTLARMGIDRNHPLYDRFGCVILDECHHAPALTYADFLRRVPYRYKYGFTATAWRKDKLDDIIWRMIGPITAKVPYDDVAEAGRIVWPEVKFIHTDYFYDIQDPSEWTQMITDLTLDQERNNFIAGYIRDYLFNMPQAKGLILTDRIEHAEILAEMARDWDPVLLTGKLKKSERVEAMGKIRDGARLTVATVHLLGEGIDVPGWDLLFLVSPFSGGPRTLQAVGRIARPAPGKQSALLLDFVDSRIDMLKGAGFSRAKLYRTKGERNREI
jgi:superfamily II DNA or RNA helicase